MRKGRKQIRKAKMREGLMVGGGIVGDGLPGGHPSGHRLPLANPTPTPPTTIPPPTFCRVFSICFLPPPYPLPPHLNMGVLQVHKPKNLNK